MKFTFEELIQRISPKLNGITHRLNGHFTFFNDEDLYQEAMEHLWIEYSLGKLSDKTDSYILQGCFFHLKNHIRTAMDKVKLTSIDQVGEDGYNAVEDMLYIEDHSAEQATDAAIIYEKIEKLMLTAREKEVMALLMEGLTLREAGSRLGISHVMVLKIRRHLEKKCAGLIKMRKNGYSETSSEKFQN